MINKTRMKLIEQVAKSSIYPELQGTFKYGEYEIINPNMGEKTKQEEI